jgi:hypothetical protein
VIGALTRLDRLAEGSARTSNEWRDVLPDLLITCVDHEVPLLYGGGAR